MVNSVSEDGITELIIEVLTASNPAFCGQMGEMATQQRERERERGRERRFTSDS